ncbi:glycosyltransferase family 2 protein [Radicibacter daui]|uniref:glycosyltransferase family 2 protein n=1 Tax=Radicibacter daui TaxID=3064829 RepID=UPI0040469994
MTDNPVAASAEAACAASRISIVVPAKEEAPTLPILVNRIREVCAEASLDLAEIVLVDDGSRDNSWQVMKDLAAAGNDVKAIRLRRNFGKATGLMVGIEATTGDIVITMDADLQDDPAELPKFVAMIEAGHDVVSGWKKERHDPVSKTLPSRFFNWITAKASGIPLHDFNCGFKAYRREIFDRVQLYGELHRYVPVLAHSLGYSVGELVVQHHAREHGVSKYGISRFLRGFLDLLTVLMITRYAYRPGHLFGGVGTIFCGLGGIMLVYLTLLKLLAGAEIGGRPLLLLGVMLVIIGIQLLLFGLLAELVNNRTQPPARNADLISARTDITPGASNGTK